MPVVFLRLTRQVPKGRRNGGVREAGLAQDGYAGPTVNWPMAGPKAPSAVIAPPELVAGLLALLIAGCSGSTASGTPPTAGMPAADETWDMADMTEMAEMADLYLYLPGCLR